MPSAVIEALLSGDALARCLTDAGLHAQVAAAARSAAPYFEPRDADMQLRAGAYTRVFEAVHAQTIAESDLAGTTGYGYNDAAREKFEAAIARLFRAERALARLSLVSGTHAIVASLAALTPPGTRLIAATGKPYDTLHNAIGEAPGSLVEHGVIYNVVALDGAGAIDYTALAATLADASAGPIASVFIQRSRGYAPRPSLSIAEITRIVAVVRKHAPHARILVDNCYCELLEEHEPIEAGADVVMGSLIKNLGGSIAPGGAYVAGNAQCIERIATRIFAPGLGDALGPTFGFGRLFFQGLLFAPQVIFECIRGLRFAAALFSELGTPVDPLPDATRYDIVQALRMGNRADVEAAARGLQRALPVNAQFRPEAGPVPGYRDQVIMSGGAFVGGATIELSCDAPLREPYELYLQGGITAEHGAIGAIAAADAMLRSRERQ